MSKNRNNFTLYVQSNMYILQMSLAVTKDELNMKPITPEEIRDAVHRFSLSCGPFADFSVCMG